MKEASGELSMTAITVVAIAAIASIFSVIVLPRIRGALTTQTKCMNKYNCSTCENGQATCSVIDENGDPETGVVCPCDEDTSKDTSK